MPGNPANLTNVNGRLFFTASDTAGTEIWTSDGTQSGTVPETDAFVFGNSSATAPRYLTNSNGSLFFTASDGSTGLEPWMLPSTPAVATSPNGLAYTAGSGQVPADSNITVTTPDNTFISAATVQIVGYIAGNDVLTFTNAVAHLWHVQHEQRSAQPGGLGHRGRLSGGASIGAI